MAAPHESLPINILLEAAISYAARGWYVFPLYGPGKSTLCECGDAACAQAAKHPRIKGGFHGATVDTGQIREWWAKWPRANIGIACGKSRLVVLDVDPRHGGDGSLSELVKRHSGALGALSQATQALVATLTSDTGGGGTHYLYTAPEGAPIRNKANLDGLAGLDVRGDGGYIVASPSLHVSGARYQWQDASILPSALPDWLLSVLRRKESQPLREPLAVFPRENDPSALWLERALAMAREGNRNDRAFWLATQLRDDGVSQPDAENVLCVYAQRVPGPGFTEREALQCVRSAYTRAARAPARSQTSHYSNAIPESMAAPAQRVVVTQEPTLLHPEQEEQRQRFQFLSLGQIISMAPPEWLISGFLAKGQRSTLFGDFGSYKSFLAMDWGLCAASGTNWHGQQVTQGRVVYIAGEGIAGLGKRARAWLAYHHLNLDLDALPIHFLGVAPQLLQMGDVEDLRRAIDALPDMPTLIFIDTLARSMVGGDENSAQDMGIAVRAVDILHADTGAHIQLLHHKTSGQAKTRGSTALPGAMDTLIEMTKDATKSPNEVTVHCGKQKDWAGFDDWTLRWERVALDEHGFEDSGLLVPLDTVRAGTYRSSVTPMSAAAQRALATLRHLGGQAWPREMVQAFTANGMAARSLNNGLTVLVDKGYALNQNGHYCLTTKSEAVEL